MNNVIKDQVDNRAQIAALEGFLRAGRKDAKVAPRTHWQPSFDVRLLPSEFTLLVDLPGVDEDDVLLDIACKKLVVSGDRPFDHDKEDAEEYSVIDRPYGRFHISVQLPDNAVTDEMRAKHKRGVLKVQIPRN